MKAAAPMALVPPQPQIKAALAKNAARTPEGSGSLEGAGKFLQLLAGKAQGSTAKAGSVHARKEARSTPAAGLEAPGQKSGLESGAGVDTEPTALTKDEKTDGKRKSAKARSLATDALTGAPASLAEARPAGVDTGAKKTNGAAKPEPASERVAAMAAQRSAAKVFILDLRRGETSATPESAAGARPERVTAESRDSATVFAQRLSAERESASAPGTPRAATPAAPSAATSLERLREMAGAELVRTTGIILKEGGGEIRLVLKPESLGNIRIRMNLVDNAIEGRIIVDNPAVKQVIEGSVDALMRALTAQGFQTASLSVSVGGQGADTQRQAQEPPAAVRREQAQGFDRSVPGLEGVSLGDLLVNLFV